MRWENKQIDNTITLARSKQVVETVTAKTSAYLITFSEEEKMIH